MPTNQRVIITGGRNFYGKELIHQVLAELGPGTVIVHGKARTGADKIADGIAKSLGYAVEPHPADWVGPCRSECRPGHRKTRFDGSDYCPLAGFYRNQEMADAGATLCIAFPGGNGTKDMAARAMKAGITVRGYE